MQAASQMVQARMGGGGSSGGGGGASKVGLQSQLRACSDVCSWEVVELTDADFDKKVLGSSEPWLVAFVAPWCGHCKNLHPNWESAAQDMVPIPSGTVLLWVLRDACAGRMVSL